MRTVVVLVVLAVLGWLFLAQKQQEHQKVATAPAQTASPSPVSHHNWAKHALDKTNKVTRQVAEQRKSDGTR
jgi:hypothetical protein